MRDFGSILPASIVVEFPSIADDCGCETVPSVWEETVTLDEAGGDPNIFAQITAGPNDLEPILPGTFTGVRRIRSTRSARWGTECPEPPEPPVSEEEPEPGPEPENQAELRTLALRIARDYYGWRIRWRDIAYGGSIDWVPEGTTDVILWTYRPPGLGGATTRAISAPHDVEASLLFHGGDDEPTILEVPEGAWIGRTTSLITGRVDPTDDEGDPDYDPEAEPVLGRGTVRLYRIGKGGELEFERESVVYNLAVEEVADDTWIQLKKMVGGCLLVDWEECPPSPIP